MIMPLYTPINDQLAAVNQSDGMPELATLAYLSEKRTRGIVTPAAFVAHRSHPGLLVPATVLHQENEARQLAQVYGQDSQFAAWNRKGQVEGKKEIWSTAVMQ